MIIISYLIFGSGFYDFDFIKNISHESLNIDLYLMEFFNDIISNSWNIWHYLYIFNGTSYNYYSNNISNINNLVDNTFIETYYTKVNELLNQDSRLIHPFINDLLFSNVLQYNSTKLDNTLSSIVLGVLFLIIGISWSNQNLTWNYWWIWDLSEMLIVLLILSLIVQLHKNENDDNVVDYNCEFFNYKIYIEDILFIFFIFYFFIIQLYNISHNFIKNPNEYMVFWFFFIITYLMYILYFYVHILVKNTHSQITKFSTNFVVIDVLMFISILVELQYFYLITFCIYLTFFIFIMYNILNIYNVIKMKFILIHFIPIIFFFFFKHTSLLPLWLYQFYSNSNYHNILVFCKNEVYFNQQILLRTDNLETFVIYNNVYYNNLLSYITATFTTLTGVFYYNTDHSLDYLFIAVLFKYVLYFNKINLI